jgi:hypothetical protein
MRFPDSLSAILLPSHPVILTMSPDLVTCHGALKVSYRPITLSVKLTQHLGGLI